MLLPNYGAISFYSAVVFMDIAQRTNYQQLHIGMSTLGRLEPRWRGIFKVGSQLRSQLVDAEGEPGTW